jgi:2-C-methyl-D-erythritol 4-phosphate cytidylyltransferase
VITGSSAVAVVICAAGSSTRMGGVKKEYQKLQITDNGFFTVLGSSVRAFAAVSSIDVIAIAIPENDEIAARKALPSEYSEASKPKILFVNGGNSRRASVFNALSVLNEYNLSGEFNTQYVLIHDGARPWLSTSLIEKLIKAVKIHNAVIPVLPLTDTPKVTVPKTRTCGSKVLGQPHFVKNHLKRANIGLAQTPQCFNFQKILRAHQKAAKTKNIEFTDDAEIWGRFCGKVAVIPGEHENRKITYREDLI